MICTMSGQAQERPTTLSLMKIEAFKSLPDDVLNELPRLCRFIHLSRGETVFTQGQDPEYFYGVLQGSFKLIRLSPAGKEVLLHLVLEGELMGAVVAFRGKPFPASAIALRRSLVVAVPTRRFVQLAQDAQATHHGLIEQVMNRVEESHALRSMQSERVEARLAHVLLLLTNRDQAKGKWLLLTKEELATLVSTSTETCIRILSKWSKDGALESARGRIRITDSAYLEEILKIQD